jgi:serine/threonine-protein kinase
VVETRPPGARVVVDGRDRGATPLTLSDVPAGTHAVRLERPGYQTISTTVRVDARTRARVAVSLTAERPR